jgi:hypothetical protein
MPIFLQDYMDWLRFMIPYWSDEWRSAFLFTQAVEIPIYLFALSRLPGPEGGRRAIDWLKLLLLAFGASAITHPFVWFFFPYFSLGHGADYYWYVIVPLAETFAVTAEAFYFSRFKLPRALGWTLIANGASFGLGLLWD